MYKFSGIFTAVIKAEKQLQPAFLQFSLSSRSLPENLDDLEFDFEDTVLSKNNNVFRFQELYPVTGWRLWYPDKAVNNWMNKFSGPDYSLFEVELNQLVDLQYINFEPEKPNDNYPQKFLSG